jgi:hypothetical protein
MLLYWEQATQLLLLTLMNDLFYRYQCEFGFTIQGRVIVVDDIRVRGVGKSWVCTDSLVPAAEGPPRVDKASCWKYCVLWYSEQSMICYLTAYQALY